MYGRHRFALIVAACFVGGPSVQAAGVFTDACGVEVFGGGASTVVGCIVGGNPLVTSRAGGKGTAGRTFLRTTSRPCDSISRTLLWPIM